MRKQRGVTMIGWIFLLTPVAVVLYAGIRVGPEYLNYYKVMMAMKETATQLKTNEALSPSQIIDSPTAKEIVVTKGDKGWTMTADYEKTVPMFGNLYITLVFNKSVVIN